MERDLGYFQCSERRSTLVFAPGEKYRRKWKYAVPRPASNWPGPIGHVIREQIRWIIQPTLVSAAGALVATSARRSISASGDQLSGRYTASTVSVTNTHWWLGLCQWSGSKYAKSVTYTWNSSVCKTNRRSSNLHADNMRGSSSEPSTGV